MLTKEEKQNILKDDKDTGGAESQVTLLSEQIKKLFMHLKENPKDIHSKRGLLRMVNKRKKILSYVKKQDKQKHLKLVQKIGLKNKA